MKSIALMLALFLCAVAARSGQEKASISDVDRARLAEAIHLADFVNNRLWRGWDRTPFAVLLVTEDREFLIRHPSPSKDFAGLGSDPLFGGTVAFRPRTQRTDFLATFPAIEGSRIPTIVVGQAENTAAKTSTPWVIVLLHEHFHQLQYSQPDYYPGVAGLSLSHGDESGMWMLNYAFPYDRAEIQTQFAALSTLLAGAIDAKGGANRAARVRGYIAARRKFQQMLAADDYRYFAFQCWQEGIARYTELRVAEMAGSKYKPTPGYLVLKDTTPYAQLSTSLRESVLEELRTQKLGDSRRVCFYAFGAAEGLLLDSVDPSWRTRYFAEPFDLGGYFEPIRSHGRY